MRKFFCTLTLFVIAVGLLASCNSGKHSIDYGMYDRLAHADDIQGLCTEGLEEYSQIGFKIRCDGINGSVRFFVWRRCVACDNYSDLHGHWVEVLERDKTAKLRGSK